MERLKSGLLAMLFSVGAVSYSTAQDETACLFVDQNTVECSDPTLKDKNNDGVLNQNEWENSQIFSDSEMNQREAKEQESEFQFEAETEGQTEKSEYEVEKKKEGHTEESDYQFETETDSQTGESHFEFEGQATDTVEGEARFEDDEFFADDTATEAGMEFEANEEQVRTEAEMEAPKQERSTLRKGWDGVKSGAESAASLVKSGFEKVGSGISSLFGGGDSQAEAEVQHERIVKFEEGAQPSDPSAHFEFDSETEIEGSEYKYEAEKEVETDSKEFEQEKEIKKEKK